MGVAPPTDGLDEEEASPASDGAPLERCGSRALSAGEILADKATVDAYMASKKSGAPQKPGAPSSAFVTGGTILVFVHVINKGPTVAEGNVTDNKIAKQANALNAAYASTGWNFYVYDIDRTTNPAWYTAVPGSPYATEMKNALHRGDESVLNLYISQPNGLAGWSTYPSDYYYNPTLDGVVIHNTTLPGGADSAYNQGKNAVHEVGHWMGLYHTFENGCANPGDSISDTPESKSATYGCPNSRDSCNSPGTDPFHNYMDFSDDSCVWEFTSGQDKRMDSEYETFRYW